MNLENHPCFNASAHRKYGRVHLPVAPRCNIQCKFCNRKFDCVNESRPGVTSGLLTPGHAMQYLEEVFQRKKRIAVVGIAGPGDPFANPEQTLETLERVRARYPDIMCCVATNGLDLPPYLDELARLRVSHVTVTVNAVDVAVGQKIYAWVRHGKRVLRAETGARILLENQLSAIRGLKERGIAVKVNAIIIPGVNDHHIPAVAEKMGSLGIDILNCVPYFPAKGSAFAHLPEPSRETVADIRETAGKFVSQMRHCTRCRADAVGLLGERDDTALMRTLQALAQSPDDQSPDMETTGRVSVKARSPHRARVAVASMEGVLVNQHLGEAASLLIYGKENGMISLLEARDTPEPGSGRRRWERLAADLSDCHTLLVSGIGDNPKRTLGESGIHILNVEGLIDEAVRSVFDGRPLRHLVHRSAAGCGDACGGGGVGCG